jgi:hypothetical protein
MFFLALCNKTYTAIETITLKVDNLACRYCSQGIAKRLLDLKSVKDVTFNDQNKTIMLTLIEKNNFNLNILKDLIEKNTHYIIKDIRISATGKIIRKGKYFTFDIENNPHLIYLDEIAQVVAHKSLMNKKEEQAQKKEKGFVASTKKAWNKTTDFVKSMITSPNRLQESLVLFYDHNLPVRYVGSVHRHADESFWASPLAQLKEIKTVSLLEQ